MKRKILITVGSILGVQAKDRPRECPVLDGDAGHGGAVCPGWIAPLQLRGVLVQEQGGFDDQTRGD